MAARHTEGIGWLRDHAGHLAAALLLVLVTGFSPTYAPADPLPPRHRFSIQAFCEDPDGAFGALNAVLRSRIRMPPSNARYDGIYSEVLERLVKMCLEGKIPEGVANQDARLNTIIRNSRISESRREKALEYSGEIIESVPVESNVTLDDILDTVHKLGTTRQQMVFTMLAEGVTQQEIASQLGVSVGLVNSEKRKVTDILRTELDLTDAKERTMSPPLPQGKFGADGHFFIEARPVPEDKSTVGPPMTRVSSPLGAEIQAVIESGKRVSPIGGAYAGPVMTIKIPRSQLSAMTVDGIIPLPVPVVLKSNAAGEQEMVVSFAREVGEVDDHNRTFALYAFCKDYDLETPSDASSFSFASRVLNPKVIDIVMRGDLRKSEAISQRLWDHYRTQ